MKAAARRKLGIGGKEPVLLYIGRLEPTKRVDRVVELGAKLKNAQIFIVGEGKEEDGLKALSSRRRVKKRTHFTGKIDEESKTGLLIAADFICLMSEPNEDTGNVEGFGIVLLEGGAFGAIPVSSGTGGMVDIVKHGETGIIVPPELSPADGAALLQRVYSNPSERKSLVHNIRQAIENRFNWNAIANELSARWQLLP
jgi:glycosyltransferase involved in cell wall biosynthesis